MRGKRSLVQVLLLLSLMAAPAWAQVQSGSIFVKAVDEQRASVPGATVTLASPVLPRPLVGITDSTGVYRFPSLGVGTYTVRIALSGFQTITRENVVVLQNQTTPIDFTMKVSAMAEEVTVSAETPVVDTKNANVSVNLDEKLLETTPGGKDIWNILEYKIPGLVFDTPDVGGNQAGLQRAFTARGTPNNQNVQLLNGVNVGDPAAIGYSMNYYEPSTFENIQVTTGAQDISMGTSGTLINMVTRSGTNRFAGQTLATYQGKKTQWDNVDGALQAAGFRPEANAVGFISNFNAQAGGPFLRNRLFYFGSYNDQRTHVNVPGYPAIPPPQVPSILSGNTQDTTDIRSVSGKLTYSLNSANRFEGYANRQWYDKPNRGASPSVTLDSNTKEYDTFPVAQVNWTSVLTDRLFLDTKLSYNNTHFPLTQKTDQQTLFDNTSRVRLRNASQSQVMFRRRLQVTSNLQYFVPDFAGGRHELKAGFDNAYTPEDVTVSRVDNVALTFRSDTGAPVNVTIYNYPRTIRRAVMNTAFYGQDSYSVGRLTLIGGIRWERVEGFIPPQSHPSGQYFPTGLVIPNVSLGGGQRGDYLVPDTFVEVRDAPLWHNWAPRVSATYDLTGRGKTVLKATAGKYLDQIGTGTPGPNPNGTISQQYTWNDANGDLIFDPGAAAWNGSQYVGGEFGSLQRTSVPSVGSPFDEARRRSYRTEYTVGVDHELIPGMRLSTTFIHRAAKDVYGNVDVDIANWDQLYSPVQVTEPGRDGLSGTADDKTLTVYQLNDPTYAQSTAPKNDDRLGTTYNGIEITATKRYSNGWTLLGGYTYSHERNQVESLADVNDARVNASGESGGRRHNFKISGSYLLPYQILFGANFRAQSGAPLTRTVTISDLTQGDVTVNAEPRGSVWTPKLITLDVRAGRYFTIQGKTLELSMDVYNLTNANTVYAVRTFTGVTNIQYAGDPNAPVTQIPSFLSPTGFLGPRIIRFNVTYNFGR